MKITKAFSYLLIGLLVVLIGGVLYTFYFDSATNSKQLEQPAKIYIEPISLSGGWGYKIKVNKKLYIYQDQIPCVPGKELFPTRESAMAMARLVKEKILRGESPAVSKEEVEKIIPENIPDGHTPLKTITME